MERPVIGITMGDPAGIGPEIIVKALKNEELYNQCKPLVIGDIRVLEFMSGILNLNSSFHVVDNPDNGRYTAGTINVLSLDNVDTKALRMGEIQPQAGKAAYEYIKEASRLCMLGDIQAVATAPIHKESIKAAGIEAIGHTEMFGELTGTEDPLTLFEVYGLRIFFLTRHLSLKDACTQVKMDRIVAYLERCHIALSRLGLARRKMAVAGVNPHSGEHGLFGKEEMEEIEPAVKRMKERGMDVEGPVPADSVFYQALKGKYDAVLSLYHDQGHIAAKMVDFEKTIALTIGLPFLRTSVDHGTAFDIAGKGIASPVSMIEAIRLAAVYGAKYNNP